MSSTCAAWRIRSAECGPTSEPDDLLRLIDRLNPGNIAGRLTLIARMGHDKVESKLPALVRAVTRSGASVVWSCDPMHGNTVKSSTGYKDAAVRPHPRRGALLLRGAPAEGSHAGGIHCEMNRPGRHRMHRRRPGDHRAGARRPTNPHPLRPAPQCQPGARAAFLIAAELKRIGLSGGRRIAEAS